MYPIAEKIKHDVTVHDLVLSDDYSWMRDKNSQKVLNHLHAENAYTEKALELTKHTQESLYKEMLGRIHETDTSVPVEFQGYFYYSRSEEGKAYSIYCRKHGSLDAPEQILLDLNALALGKSYLRLGAYSLSPDQKTLLYSLDNDGSESFTVYLKNLDTEVVTETNIQDSSPAAAWSAAGDVYFYVLLDSAKRPYQLYRKSFVSQAEKSALVYEENDEAFFLSIGKTKDRKMLLMSIHSQVTSEAHYLDASNPFGKFQCVAKRRHEHEYSIDHRNGELFILSNADGAVNFKLMKAPISNCAQDLWVEVITHRPEVKLEGVEIFSDFMVLYEREDGITHLRLRSFEKTEDYRIAFDEAAYTVDGASNPNFKTDKFRFSYSSLVIPSSVYEYDVRDKSRVLLKRQEIVGGYDPSLYETKRIFAVSHDGVRVPVSIVYKKGIKLDGNNPFFLYGYGSYGISMDPEFSSNRLSLLDRGFVYGIAHIRGGADLGRPWYEAGKKLKKKNTFYDFIAAAQYVIQEKYTSSEKLVIMGGSAGGMLMGAVTNMRPDLFKAVIAKVPFVDVINTMLDPTLPLTVIEYDEWGNPNEKEYFDEMLSYSPYDNVKPAKYPDMLITGGLNDPRVQYWEPSKWAQKLRENNLGDSKILLKIDMTSGHGGKSGRYEYLKEVALDYAFFFECLNLRPAGLEPAT